MSIEKPDLKLREWTKGLSTLLTDNCQEDHLIMWQDIAQTNSLDEHCKKLCNHWETCELLKSTGNEHTWNF